MTTTALKARKEFGKTLAADIAHRLRNEIVTCQLKPDKSLKFDALRLSFGASFTTLREALTLLAAEGLVLAEEQRGYKVAPVTLDDLSDLTHARILFERAERYRNLSALFRPHPRDKTGEHRALMQAAISRNAEQACSLIRTHIQTTSDNVAKYASGVIGSH